VRSSEGLGGMSRAFHRLFLDRLLPRNWSDESPPVLLNTWEAKYFHINHHNVLEIAKTAVKTGIDMLVVDDGWFGDRTDDTSSLGDWVVNKDKFPQGLSGLVDEINEIGMKFGLWFEPEMVSESSVRE
jgi:alpha-galactosidase